MKNSSRRVEPAGLSSAVFGWGKLFAEEDRRILEMMKQF